MFFTGFSHTYSQSLNGSLPLPLGVWNVGLIIIIIVFVTKQIYICKAHYCFKWMSNERNILYSLDFAVQWFYKRTIEPHACIWYHFSKKKLTHFQNAFYTSIKLTNNYFIVCNFIWAQNVVIERWYHHLKTRIILLYFRCLQGLIIQQN